MSSAVRSPSFGLLSINESCNSCSRPKCWSDRAFFLSEPVTSIMQYGEVSAMPRKPRPPRPSDIVMDELVGEHVPWDLEKHLKGCLAGYQTDPSYGAAVYFALEALLGIARDVEVRAKDGKLDPDEPDADWIISPNTRYRAQRRRPRGQNGLFRLVRSERARRPRYLLSGLLRCGTCGGGFSKISQTHYGCSTARNKGTCRNLLTLRRDDLEAKVLDRHQASIDAPGYGQDIRCRIS